MRGILVVAITLAVAIRAFKRPWIGVMLWAWISIMNPHAYTWGFARSAPVAMIAAVVTLIGLLTTQERQSPFKGAPTWWLLAFVVIVTLSWVFGYDPEGDYYLWTKVMKIYFMTFVTLALLSNKYHIMAYALVTVGSLGLLGAKGGFFTILTGGSYRVYGPPGSFIADNNSFALSLIMIIPLLNFFRLQFDHWRAKHGTNIVMLLCAISAIGSYSRGAFLAIGAMGALFWWRTQQKAFISVVIIFMILIILPMMPQEWWSRMDTIQTYQEDGSAMGRINAWWVAWEVARHRFLGAGMFYQHDIFFQKYGFYEITVRAAHSIYFQILGNHGFIGLVLFLSFWFSTYRTAGWLRKNARKISEAQWAAELGAMTQVGLVGYAVGGAFLSLAYFDLPYNMMVMVVLAKQWVLTKGWERDPMIPFLEYAGFSNKRNAAIRKSDQNTFTNQRSN